MSEENVEIARGFYDAYRAGDFPSGAESFVDPEFEFAHLITLRGGRISRIDSFAHLEEALEAAGLSE